jgi:hypothetical protein
VVSPDEGDYIDYTGLWNFRIWVFLGDADLFHYPDGKMLDEQPVMH